MSSQRDSEDRDLKFSELQSNDTEGEDPAEESGEVEDSSEAFDPSYPDLDDEGGDSQDPYAFLTRAPPLRNSSKRSRRSSRAVWLSSVSESDGAPASTSALAAYDAASAAAGAASPVSAAAAAAAAVATARTAPAAAVAPPAAIAAAAAATAALPATSPAAVPPAPAPAPADVLAPPAAPAAAPGVALPVADPVGAHAFIENLVLLVDFDMGAALPVTPEPEEPGTKTRCARKHQAQAPTHVHFNVRALLVGNTHNLPNSVSALAWTALNVGISMHKEVALTSDALKAATKYRDTVQRTGLFYVNADVEDGKFVIDNCTRVAVRLCVFLFVGACCVVCRGCYAGDV